MITVPLTLTRFVSALSQARIAVNPIIASGQASPLKIGSTITGTILPKGDNDWYRISAAWPGELKVHISNVAGQFRFARPSVEFGETHAVSSWVSPLKAGGDTQGTLADSQSGDVFPRSSGWEK